LIFAWACVRSSMVRAQSDICVVLRPPASAQGRGCGGPDTTHFPRQNVAPRQGVWGGTPFGPDARNGVSQNSGCGAVALIGAQSHGGVL